MTPSDLVAKITESLREEGIELGSFLGFLKSVGVIGSRATDLSFVPSHVLSDACTNWTDTLTSYTIWKEQADATKL
jgi:hypothetical protein